MNLKDTLKSFKLNESTISMLLGAVVVAVVGILVINYVRGQNTAQDILPNAETIEDSKVEAVEQGNTIEINKTYIVTTGDSLWSIAERAYGSGDAWKVIADANNLSSGRDIKVGQEISIPATDAYGGQIAQISDIQNAVIETPFPTTLSLPTNQPLPLETITPQETPIVTATPESKEEIEAVAISDTENQADNPITGDKYTVETGDTLWDIAQRAYGDPFKWTEIAKANNLANPNLIHRGNEFIIPR